MELAEEYGIHRTTALAVLERHRVPRRGRVWTPELTELAIQLYGEGRSCGAIAGHFGVNPETVRQHLIAAGRSGLPDEASQALDPIWSDIGQLAASVDRRITGILNGPDTTYGRTGAPDTEFRRSSVISSLGRASQ